VPPFLLFQLELPGSRNRKTSRSFTFKTRGG
jgi:hypothetical protein